MLYIEEGLEKVIGLLGSEFCIYGKYTKLYSINKQLYSYSNKKKTVIQLCNPMYRYTSLINKNVMSAAFDESCY